MSDGELMKAIALGNSAAFRELFARHASVVLGYGKRMVKDHGLAEDVSQEVWMRVVRAASQYQDRNTFRSWLLNIVRNTALNLLRSRSALESVADTNESTTAFARHEVENLLNQQSEVQKIKKLIEALPDQQRVALVIWLSEEVSYEDLARELDTTTASVKSLLFRARRTLEQQLKGAG